MSSVLVYVGAPNLWGHFRDVLLEACDKVCVKKRGKRSIGDTWWWNEEVKVAVSRKIDAHKVMCQNCTEENKRRYKRRCTVSCWHVVCEYEM